MLTLSLALPRAVDLDIDEIVELEAVVPPSVWEKIAYTELGIMVGLALEALISAF